MAFACNKVPFPKELLTVDYSLSLNLEGISEDGEPLADVTAEGKCIFSEKAKRILDSEGKRVTLLGKVIIEGDVAPSLTSVCDGNITVNGRKYEIWAGYRPRNPDGTVHHTTFEVK